MININNVDLAWKAGKTPFSRRFSDVYYSNLDGLEESNYVFLKNNLLPELWLEKPEFIIAETGFGTGLNFFATWKLWRETTAPGARLYYFSVEKYPLSLSQITMCISEWPELLPFLKEFRDSYSITTKECHSVILDGGEVILKILVGDVVNVLSKSNFKADVWFLDGFAPARNPDMWSSEVFNEVARLSKSGSRFATFSAASSVRKGLSQVGFSIKKKPGFGRKREMLSGYLN